MRAHQDYDNIPGTFIFDADRSRRGYGVNMFCMSLLKASNRDAFKANEEIYLGRFTITPEQRNAILARQWNRILELGGNIYFLGKLAAADGLSFQQVAAQMAGMTPDAYTQMMLSGGRAGSPTNQMEGA